MSVNSNAAKSSLRAYFEGVRWPLKKASFLSGSDNNAENQLLLTYIVERYANMWGTYFVRHLKGHSRNLIQKLADRQATRTKVAHTVIYARKVEPDDDTFVSDDTPEC